MVPIYFTAVLRTEDGKITETGEACVSRIENKITFRSDFVPLVKLGTTVEIVRILGSKELEQFAGQVYLSSRNLLQIIVESDEAIANARRLFDINDYLPAYFALSPNNSPNFSTRKAELIAGTIRYLSDEVVKVSAMPYIGQGQYLMVECELPLPLKATVLRVEERVLLGSKASILLCSIAAQPAAERKALHSYVEQLSKQTEEIDLHF